MPYLAIKRADEAPCSHRSAIPGTIFRVCHLSGASYFRTSASMASSSLPASAHLP